jgi:glycosyltransferase involved in cell wall biosynthesis
MLSLIIPVYNEEGAVEDIIRRADAVLEGGYEIIVVDDGSTDATPGILKKIELESLRIIRHSKNTGNGATILTGIEHAKGEWIATIDADDTYRPEDIPRLFEQVQSEGADMIVGIRRNLMDGPFFHKTARNFLRKFAEVCSGQKIDDINSGLRICRKELIERYVNLYPNRFSLHIVLMVCAGKERAKILYEPISYGPRIGISKLSPGLRGPWNFLKFVVLIPWSAKMSKTVQNTASADIPNIAF